MTCFCWVSTILFSRITKDQATRMGVNTLVWGDSHSCRTMDKVEVLGVPVSDGLLSLRLFQTSPTCVPTVESLPV